MEIKGKFSVVAAPEVKFSKAGKARFVVRVANNQRTKDADGNWAPLMWEDAKDKYDSVSEFFEVNIFEGTEGYALAESLNKGDFIEVSGRRDIRGYINKNGERVVAQSIAANAVTVISKRDGASAPAAKADKAADVADVEAPF